MPTTTQAITARTIVRIIWGSMEFTSLYGCIFRRALRGFI